MRSVIVSLLLCGSACFAQDDQGVRFAAVDVYLDSPAPVAAWQFELQDNNGLMTVVGVENGASSAYPRAPYYDRDAVQAGTADRIIVADFSLAERAALPSGRIRIATIHVMLTGSGAPDFVLRLVTANNFDGQVIDASIGLEYATGSEQ